MEPGLLPQFLRQTPVQTHLKLNTVLANKGENATIGQCANLNGRKAKAWDTATTPNYEMILLPLFNALGFTNQPDERINDSNCNVNTQSIFKSYQIRQSLPVLN
jgi:hypothetical protein